MLFLGSVWFLVSKEKQICLGGQILFGWLVHMFEQMCVRQCEPKVAKFVGVWVYNCSRSKIVDI